MQAGVTCLVNRQTIFLAGLSPAFEGFRMALLSDFHFSPWITSEYLRRVVGMTNALQPDLIVLTGDYVNHNGRKWAPGCMRALADLSSPHGVIGVLGNHDHYQGGASPVRDAMKRAGIVDLTNTSITLQRDGEVFHLGGVGDLWKERQKLPEAIGSSRTPRSVVLLSHNPDYAERIHDDRIGVVLSGHTHGGQCVFPLVGALRTASRYGSKYLAGLCQAPSTQVFVTRGVGASFPAIRIGAPAEVVLLTLRRRAKSS
jgi:predicted MPP superfamily phosphohydrolase